MVREDLEMKSFLFSAVAAAALVIAAPAWAQQQQQYNPATGQPGLGAPMTPQYPHPNSATPPAHHAYKHARAMHAHHKYMAKKAALTGDTTAQLNREELARIQSGNLSNPPAPPPPGPGGPAPMGGPPPH
jgi:opacity protein-like surface antigen